MVAHAQHDRAGEVVGAVQPQSPPHGGLRSCLYVIEFAAWRGRRADQFRHGRHDRCRGGEPFREGIRRLGPCHLIRAEPLAVGGHLVWPDPHRRAAARQITGRGVQDLLYGPAGQRGALHQRGQVERFRGQQRDQAAKAPAVRPAGGHKFPKCVYGFGEAAGLGPGQAGACTPESRR